MIIFGRQHQSERVKLNLFKIKLFVLFILLVISVSFTSASQSNNSQIDTSKEVIKQNAPKNSNSIVTILIPLVAAAIGAMAGAMAGALTSIAYFKKQSEKEYISLILAFCSEMVSIYWRCAEYYKQSKKGVISYSALFSFTDSSALSKFASVCQKPAVVAAIVELKSMYFQIQRHVEDASRLAIEGNLALTQEDKNKLMNKAVLVQGTALAFFLGSSYIKIEKEMDLLVETTQQVAPGVVANNLHSKYLEAKAKKIKVDKGIIED